MISVIKQLQIDKRIRVGYGAAFILLLTSYLFTLYSNQELMEQTKKVIRTNNIIIYLDDLLAEVKDAESNVRNYLLTTDKKFLLAYQTEIKKTDSTFVLLTKASDNNPNFKQEDIDLLKKVTAQKNKFLTTGLQFYGAHKYIMPDTLNNIGADSKTAMDTVNNVVKRLQLKKSTLLAQKTAIIDGRYKTMNMFVIISLIVASLFALLGLLTYIRENKARKTSDRQVVEFQKQLQLRIDELDAANKELVLMRRIEKFAATGRIARSIAHEVRNPLTNIDLAIGQIKSELPAVDENLSMLFDMVNRNSKRINQLITELLNATRFGELNSQAVSVNVLLDEALELAKDRIALTHIKIEKNYSTDMCDITADKEKVKIAFLNVIVNAAESMEKEGGLLKIITRGEADKCIVEIIDNGVGMDGVALSKLFEPYFTTKQKGNGLGLTNTQNIILNHKGSISVESTPGKGTAFTIRFYFKEEAIS